MTDRDPDVERFDAAGIFPTHDPAAVFEGEVRRHHGVDPDDEVQLFLHDAVYGLHLQIVRVSFVLHRPCPHLPWRTSSTANPCRLARRMKPRVHRYDRECIPDDLGVRWSSDALPFQEQDGGALTAESQSAIMSPKGTRIWRSCGMLRVLKLGSIGSIFLKTWSCFKRSRTTTCTYSGRVLTSKIGSQRLELIRLSYNMLGENADGGRES